MRLADLAVGGTARVLTIAPLDEVGCRLLEMGMTPGATVRMVGTAPLGDPIEVEVRSYRLSLRRAEAARVEVEPS